MTGAIFTSDELVWYSTYTMNITTSCGRICDDCYMLYRDAEVHQLCRWKTKTTSEILKTLSSLSSLEIWISSLIVQCMKNNCQKYKCFDRSRCYSSPFFGYCMDVMMVRPKRIAKHESAKIKCISNFVLCIFNDGKTKMYSICESAKKKMYFEQPGEQKK